MKIWQKLCPLIYDLTIFLAICIIVIAPIHSYFTAHINISKTISSDRFVFEAKQSTRNLKIGDSIPIFRYDPKWKTKLGDAKIIDIKDHKIFCTINTETLHKPIGDISQIISQTGSMVTLNSGSDLSLKLNDIINVFAQDKLLGSLQIVEVTQNSSTAKIISSQQKNLVGATASKNKNTTQVSFLTNKLVEPIEIIILTGALAFWGFSRIIKKRSAFYFLMIFLSKNQKVLQSKFSFLVLNAALGIPFIYIVATFSFNLIQPLLIAWFRNKELFDVKILYVAYIILAFYYYLHLFLRKQSPILHFCTFFRYKKPLWKNKSTIQKRVAVSILNIIIVLVFSNTLVWFFVENLRLIVFISQKPISEPTIYQILRLITYEIIIIIVCITYIYSIIIEFFTQKIRNLDFSIAGWITNGVCYGSIFRITFISIIPTFYNGGPIISTGFLIHLIMPLEFIITILYGLSVINLGTKLGVMADKGIKSTGFYGIIRHPIYALEGFMFVMIEITEMSESNIWIVAYYSLLLYFIRSEREDHFMSISNPDYLEYRKQVPYKYIQGVY